MLAKELLQGGRGPLFQGMDSLDQAEDVGGHDQQVAKASRAGIPIGVRRAARNEDGGTCARFDFVFAGLDPKGSFQHVPCFVVFMVDVTRSDKPRWPGGAACILPLGDDERIV